MTVALNDILLAAENLVTQIQTFQSEQVTPTLESDLAEVDTLETRIVAEAEAQQAATDAAAAVVTPAPAEVDPANDSTTETSTEGDAVDTLEDRLAAQAAAAVVSAATAPLA